MTNEHLIEEAAIAIHSVAESGASWFDARMADKAQHRAEARAALAVFEEAHTPANDEREGWGIRTRMIHIIHSVRSNDVFAIVDALIADGIGFRRSEVPEPSGEHPDHAKLGPSACPACGFDPMESQGEPPTESVSNSEVPGDAPTGVAQGEPSDAQVRAAWEAYITAQEADPYDREGRMRAALRAAAEAGGSR